MNSERCVRVIVTGQVQGVGFRAATKEIAQRYGITGSAENRQDGSVDVTACGEEDSIAQLVNWLHKGPEGARVDEVVVEEASIPTPSGFKTG